MSIRRRLSLAAAIAVALTFLIVSAAAYLIVRSQMREAVDDSLRSRISSITAVVGKQPPRQLNENQPIPPSERELFGGAAGLVQFRTASGAVIGTQADRELPMFKDTRAVTAGKTYFEDVTVDGMNLRMASARMPNGAYIQVARPLEEVNGALSNMLFLLSLLAPVGVGLAALLGALTARASLAPIIDFTRRTEEVAGDTTHRERIEVASSDELGRLADTFNSTLDALEESVVSQRQLVSDASHELRTPLTSLRANAEILGGGFDQIDPEDRKAVVEDIVEQVDEMTAIVEDVVQLARGSAPPSEVTDVDLAEVIGEAADRCRRDHPGVDIRLDLDDTVVKGDVDALARMVKNLLDNAARWGDGRIEVALVNGTMTVRDHGPGFKEADLHRVFDRFYRAAELRSDPGSGLGLAIVNQIAAQHGGNAWALNAPGGGAVIGVTLPTVDDGR